MKNTRQVPSSIAAAMMTQRREMFELAAKDIEETLLSRFVFLEISKSVAEIVRLLGDVVEENQRLQARERKFKDEMTNASRSVGGIARRLDRLTTVSDELNAHQIDEAVRRMAEDDED